MSASEKPWAWAAEALGLDLPGVLGSPATVRLLDALFAGRPDPDPVRLIPANQPDDIHDRIAILARVGARSWRSRDAIAAVARLEGFEMALAYAGETEPAP